MSAEQNESSRDDARAFELLAEAQKQYRQFLEVNQVSTIAALSSMLRESWESGVDDFGRNKPLVMTIYSESSNH